MFTEIKAAVERLREVGLNATPGPWKVQKGHDSKTARSVVPILRWNSLLRGSLPFEANAQLIAAAPLLLPMADLLAAQSDYIEAMQSGTQVAGKWEAVVDAAEKFLEVLR